MTPTYLFAMLGVMITILLAVFAYLITLSREVSKSVADHCRLTEAHEEKLARIPVIEDHLNRVDSKVDTMAAQQDIYFKVLDKYIVGTIHSPTHKERDDLMDKMNDGTLNCKEAVRLSVLLDDLMREETNPEKRLAAALGKARVESLIYAMRCELKRGRNASPDPKHSSHPHPGGNHC